MFKKSHGFIFLILLICQICAAKEVRLVTLNWTPYFSAYLPEQGFVSKIANEAFRRAGHTAKITFIPWKKAMDEAKVGHYDAVLGAYYLPEREQYFNYSKPLYSVEVVGCYLKTSPLPVKAYQELISKKIAILRGGTIGTEFEKFRSQIRVVEFSSYAHGLNWLAMGRVDMMVDAQKVLQHHILLSEQSVEKFDYSQPLTSEDLFVIFSKRKPDSEQLRNSFNQALMSMISDGEYLKIVENQEDD